MQHEVLLGGRKSIKYSFIWLQVGLREWWTVIQDLQ